MSAPRKKPTLPEKQKKLEHKHKRHVRSPCGRPPIVPRNLFGEFDRKGGGRYHRLRAKLRWDEVHEDTSGFNIMLHYYVVEWEYSDDDVTYAEAERYHVPPKGDNDPNDKHQFVLKGSILAKLAYRYRVRAVALNGCKGDWSEYYYLGAPAGDLPPAPQNVRVYDKGIDRLIIDWDAPTDSADNEILDERIAHFSVWVAHSTNASPPARNAQGMFTNVYKKDLFVHNTKHTFKVEEADQGDYFFAVVRSIGVDHDKSIAVPAKQSPNSDPFATPDGVQVGVPPASEGVPIGTIHWHAGPNLPPKWLRCNGAGYSIDGEWKELFWVIGYKYGNGDGHSGNDQYFGVPDMKNRKVVGSKGDGTNLGGNEGSAEVDRLEDHDPHGDHDDVDHAHDEHDGHPGHGKDQTAETGHQHNFQVGNATGVSDPDNSHYVINVTGGGAGANDLAKRSHQHDIQGWSGPPGSAYHLHPHDLGHNAGFDYWDTDTLTWKPSPGHPHHRKHANHRHRHIPHNPHKKHPHIVLHPIIKGKS